MIGLEELLEGILALRIVSQRSAKSVIVGPGGHISIPTNALATLGSRWSNRLNDSQALPAAQSLTFTNGSATVVKAVPGTGEAFGGLSGSAWRIGDWLSTDGIKHHRMKKFTDVNTIELWGPWAGITGNFNVQPRYTNKLNLQLLPGDYPYMTTLPPGINLFGSERDSVVVGQDVAFGVVGENIIANLTLGPSILFGSMDHMCDGMNTTELGAGARFIGNNIKIICGSLNGAHNGGNLSWPVMTGGLSGLYNSEIILAGNGGSLSYGGLAAFRSIVHWKDVTISNDTDIQAISGGVGQASFDDGYNSADYVDIYLDDLRVLYKDIGKNPTFGMAIGAITLGGPNNKTYITNLKSEVRNSNTAAGVTEIPGCVKVMAGEVHIDGGRGYAYGQVTGPANAGEALIVAGGTVNVRNFSMFGRKYSVNQTGGTVNLMGVDIESDGTGIFVNAAGAVCNVRAGTRVKGTTNSINCAAGTVNVSPNADLIGATTGAGTINLATAT